MSTLKRTSNQVHEIQSGFIGIKGIPNPWWGLRTGNDCVGFQLTTLGIRSRTDYTGKHVSISAFRKAYGWHEIDLSEEGWNSVRFGDLICEEWPSGERFTGVPTHMERFVAKEGNRITTASANTGPTPGVAVPRGAWVKTRTLTDASNWVVAIRPPYAGEEETSPCGAKPPKGLTSKAQVKLVARYVNNWAREKYAHLPTTKSEEDGVPGRNYWTLVQRWGRDHDLYGNTYRVDGIVGPRTQQIEKVVLKRAQAAKAASKKK